MSKGIHPAGTKVAIMGVYVVDVAGSEVYVAFLPECLGDACGDLMGILMIDSGPLPPPPAESFPDIYGTTADQSAGTSGASIIADGWAYRTATALATP